MMLQYNLLQKYMGHTKLESRDIIGRRAFRVLFGCPSWVEENKEQANIYENLETLTGRPTPPHLVDLLKGLLKLDPTRRLSARQALNHPYFADIPIANRMVPPSLTNIEKLTRVDSVCYRTPLTNNTILEILLAGVSTLRHNYRCDKSLNNLLQAVPVLIKCVDKLKPQTETEISWLFLSTVIMVLSTILDIKITPESEVIGFFETNLLQNGLEVYDIRDHIMYFVSEIVRTIQYDFIQPTAIDYFIARNSRDPTTTELQSIIERTCSGIDPKIIVAI